MTFLPVVERELQVAARRWATYWVRALFGLVAIAVGALVLLGSRHEPSAAVGANLFNTLIWLGVFYCLGGGVQATADCLSEEKREGTLGLLFLTDLRGYDVVLGKLAATSCAGFYYTLATFPIMAIPLLLGGVTPGEFWRAMLVLANTFLFSLAVGLFVSSISRNGRKARVGTLGFLLFFVGICPAVAGLIYLLVPSHRSPVADALLLPCPFYGLSHAGYGTSRTVRALFWTSVGVTHGLAWLFLALASLIAPRAWQDRPAGAWRRVWQAGWRRLAFGNAAFGHSFRTRLLERNPVSWLAGRARIKEALVWACLGVVAAFWAWGCIQAGHEWFNEGVYFPTAILLNSLLKIWLASEAGRQLGEDRKSGALELLLSTPLTVKEVLRGQWQALRRQFLGPVLTVMAVELIFLASSLQRESFADQPRNPVIWAASLTLLVLDLLALGWVAIWGAMIAKNPTHTTGFSLGRILWAPWVLYVVIAIVVAIVKEEMHSQSELTWKFYIGLWFGLGLLFDLGFGLAAALHLHLRFRALALRRFAPRPRRLAWLFRKGRTQAAGGAR